MNPQEQLIEELLQQLSDSHSREEALKRTIRDLDSKMATSAKENLEKEKTFEDKLEDYKEKHNNLVFKYHQMNDKARYSRMLLEHNNIPLGELDCLCMCIPHEEFL